MAHLIIRNVVTRIVYNLLVANYVLAYLLVDVIRRITLSCSLLD